MSTLPGMSAWARLDAQRAESDRLWEVYEKARKRCEAARAREVRLSLAYDEANKALTALWAKVTEACKARGRATAAEDKAFDAWRAVALADVVGPSAGAKEG